MLIINCDIDCNTNKCTLCGNQYGSCNVKVNCIADTMVSEKDFYDENGEQKIRPGTELKRMLSKMGFKTNHTGCKCNDHAKKMDYLEQAHPGWCEDNIDTICGWLEVEAKKRRLPFIKTAAVFLIKRAIKKAYKR